MLFENLEDGVALFGIVFSHIWGKASLYSQTLSKYLFHGGDNVGMDLLATPHCAVAVGTVYSCPAQSVAGELRTVVYTFHKSVAGLVNVVGNSLVGESCRAEGFGGGVGRIKEDNKVGLWNTQLFIFVM